MNQQKIGTYLPVYVASSDCSFSNLHNFSYCPIKILKYSLMKCIVLYITKSIRGVITDLDTAKCKYFKILVVIKV